MSSKRSKHKAQNKRKYKPLMPSKATSKPRGKVIDLRSVLQSIYHDSVNLETTCNHRCECCNVAMPQMNYCEFVQIITILWNKLSNEEKIELIGNSIEYFFRNEYEKWGMEILVKPCMLLEKDGRCACYADRPLSCRMYGLWPKEVYNKRVDKFEKAFSKYGVKRNDLPLSKQCPFVKRVDSSVELTPELIDQLYDKLNVLDKDVGGFTQLQADTKENYRTFHDWLLLKIYGEKWLILLTSFMLAATKDLMMDQIAQLKKEIRVQFKDGLPDISKAL